jgi:hypothetical protein
MNTELEESHSGTTAVATAADTSIAQQEADRDANESVTEKQDSAMNSDDERLAALFSPDVAKEFRTRWDALQSSFVDDPRRSVREGDALVAQVMKSLTETFSKERAKLEGQLDQTDKASTENLRVALRRYHSFFERLLAL